MSQLEVKRIKEVRQGLTSFFKKVCGYFGSDSTIYELMSYRGYHTQEMFNTLKEIGVFKVEYLSDIRFLIPEVTDQQLREWGLVNEKGDYILSSRFVLPIRDIAGNVIALVGWHPKGGSRKYVTTPTLGFSRDASFFNLDCYSYSIEQWRGIVFLVEGIFDTISLRSIGLPAIGNQGLEMSSIKSHILTRFSKVIGIPDNDMSGRGVNPITNPFSGKSTKFIWRIQNDHVFAILPEGVKDIDTFITDYEAYDDLVSCIDARYLVRLKVEA